jgi:hypothetical protein
MKTIKDGCHLGWATALVIESNLLVENKPPKKTSDFNLKIKIPQSILDLFDKTKSMMAAILDEQSGTGY